MSYSSAKWIAPSEKKPVFSGWFVDNASPVQIANNQSPYLRNARIDGYGIKIRPGFSLFATLAAGSYPKGIGYYNRVSNANDRLIVRHNISGTEKLYSITSAGALTAITTAWSIASDNRMRFTNGNEVIYCMNGSDLFGQVSWTTFTQITANVPASFAPAFSVVFNGSHWASGWPTNPLKVYKSVGSNYSDFSSSGSDVISMPGPVTGLAATNEMLAYFTSETVSATTISDIIDTAWTLTYVSRNIQAKEGAVNHDSIVAAGNSIFYVTPTNKIVQILRGSNVSGFEIFELSERPFSGISNLMNSLDSDQSDSFGYFYPPDNLIKWHFKSIGSTFNDVCIVYDIQKDAFLIDTQKYLYGGTMWGAKAYTISMLEPKVFQDEVNQDDEDSAIDFEYRTREFDLWEPTRKKTLWETRTYGQINELAELTQEIYINDALVDSKTIDSDNISVWWGGIWALPIWDFPIWDETDNSDEMSDFTLLRTKWNLNSKWDKIQFRFVNTSLAWKVLLLDLNMKVEMLPAEATKLTI